MSELSAPAESSAQRPTITEDAFDRLIRVSWRKGLVAIVAGGTASLAQPYLMKIAIDRYVAVRTLAELAFENLEPKT